MKKLILVVNYNKKIEYSETYQSLKRIKSYLEKMNYHVYIWDNCLEESNKELLKKEKWITYKGMIENYSLSYIYNYIIKKVIANFNYLIILDNDSILSDEYFLKLEKALEKNEDIYLFLPKIVVQNQVFSPQKIFYEKIKSNEKISDKVHGKIESKNFTAINSGMVIATKYLENKFIKYDENLGFYGTDNFFMLKYQRDNKYMYIIDYKMQHDLSMNKKENLKITLWRFKDQVRGIKILLKYLNLNGKILSHMKIINLVLKNTVKYNSFEFIKEFLRSNR